MPENRYLKEEPKEENDKPEEQKAKEPTTNFEKIEVAIGVSNMGYTAITLVKDIPANAKIVTKGAFFVNAKLTNKGEE